MAIALKDGRSEPAGVSVETVEGAEARDSHVAIKRHAANTDSGPPPASDTDGESGLGFRIDSLRAVATISDYPEGSSDLRLWAVLVGGLILIATAAALYTQFG